MNGWKTEKVFKEPAEVQASIAVNNKDLEHIYEKHIIAELYRKLMTDFIKTDKLDVVKTQDPYYPFNQTIFKAKVKFVPDEFKYASVYENSYEVDGVKFTKEQIEQALYEQFPEYFI